MNSKIARDALGIYQKPVEQNNQQLKLTTREREVLELLSHGLPDKLIADKLYISASTVRFHLRHIYAKLHVRSRTEAALKHNEAKALVAGHPVKLLRP